MLGRLAAIAFFLSVPLVSAQPPPEPVVEFSVTGGHEGNLGPESEIALFDLRVAWSCSFHELQNPDQTTSVIFQVVQPSEHVTVTLAPTVGSRPSAPPDKCTDDALVHEFSGTMQVSVDRSAPAYVPIPVRVEVTLERDAGSVAYGAGASWGPYEDTVAVTPDYLPSIQVLPDSIIQVVPEGTVASFPLTIINFSNGGTRVAFEIQEHAPGLVIPGIEEIALPGPESPSAERTQRVEISVRTPGVPSASSRMFSFDATARARSEEPGRDLERQEITIPLSVKVVDSLHVEDVPGNGLVLALLAVAAVFGAQRRSRT